MLYLNNTVPWQVKICIWTKKKWLMTKANWNEELKTIHKCFLCPIKGRAQCFASMHSDFHEHLWSHDAGKACLREGYITWKLPITNTCACVESPHYLAWFVVCFPIVIRTLLQNFDHYITFYLCCKCANAHVPVLLAM